MFDCCSAATEMLGPVHLRAKNEKDMTPNVSKQMNDDRLTVKSTRGVGLNFKEKYRVI